MNKKVHPINFISALIALLFMMLLSISPNSRAGEFTVLGGMAKFNPPHDGIYWNMNQPHDKFLTPAAWALRYDIAKDDYHPFGFHFHDYSFGIQYTNFGEVKMDAMAVTKDAPESGGYISGTGTCVGTCAPLARWKMTTETQAIAFIGTKHFNKWSFDIGIAAFETRTKGHVEQYQGSPASQFKYSDTTWLGYAPMVGVGYRFNDRLSAKAQLYRMEGRAREDDHTAPPAQNENYQLLFLLGYTF